jgi:hypothetical protein
VRQFTNGSLIIGIGDCLKKPSLTTVKGFANELAGVDNKGNPQKSQLFEFQEIVGVSISENSARETTRTSVPSYLSESTNSFMTFDANRDFSYDFTAKTTVIYDLEFFLTVWIEFTIW